MREDEQTIKERRKIDLALEKEYQECLSQKKETGDVIALYISFVNKIYQYVTISLNKKETIRSLLPTGENVPMRINLSSQPLWVVLDKESDAMLACRASENGAGYFDVSQDDFAAIKYISEM